MSTRHQEGLAHLLYGINYGGGFVALTGEVGTGKTTLCQCLLQQLPDEVDLALVLNPKLSAADLLATICDELAIEYDRYRLTLKHLVDRLNLYLLEAHANGRRTVLMIDEAQNLSLGVLEQIRLLTNLETSKSKLLQIILVGQPELQQLLASPRLRQLNQRITARYHLLPLNKDETLAYIQHRLKICHGNPEIFNKAVTKRIHRLSGGIPRLINMICDRALLGAYVHDSHKVTPAMVNQAAGEIDSQLIAQPRRRRLLFESGVLLSCMIAAAIYHWPILIIKKQASTEVVVDSRDKIQTAMPEKSAAVEASTEQAISETPEETLEPVLTLSEYLQQNNLSMQQAYDELLKLWGLATDMSPDDCSQLVMPCLTGLGDWRELVSLKRPVMLELVDDIGTKQYLVLVGVKQGSPVFLDRGEEISFSLHQLLNFWQGYYLLLWQPPLTGADYIYPKQKSSAVAWLREQLDGIQKVAEQSGSPTDYYDAALTRRVREFQRKQHLLDDGIAGPLTLIHLQNAGGGDYGPRLLLDD